MAIAIRDDHYWTREEYEQRVEEGFFQPGERVELVDGVLYEMSPQFPDHAQSISRALYKLLPLFSTDFHVRIQMPLALGADSEPEPDVAVVPGSPESYDTHPTSSVLIIEVADSSLLHDRKRKASLYARTGIPDYWVVNLVDWRLEVYREPQDGKYKSHIILRPEDSISPLVRPEIRIVVADLLPKKKSQRT
jgi:Uma2 family endonuclease